MKEKEIKLLPCPFCNGNPELRNDDGEYWYVSCNECINQTTHFFNGRDVVIARWNRRDREARLVDACERPRVMFAVATPITSHGHGDSYGGLGIQQISGYTPPVRFNPIFCTEKSALEWMKTNNIRGQIVELQIYDDFARQVKAELEGK